MSTLKEKNSTLLAASEKARNPGSRSIEMGSCLRNALELLLANMDGPSRIINKFTEYAGERPVGSAL